MNNRTDRVGHAHQVDHSHTSDLGQDGMMQHENHTAHAGRPSHEAGGVAHVDHTGHEAMFRRRFWISSLISVPVLLYSSSIQQWLGISPPVFTGSEWITPVFSAAVFAYGGLPFLRMAQPEVRNRQPGMMLLISLAITVSLVYSLATLVLPGTQPFFWELVTLIDVMLLGHWIEMQSVRRASSALDALAKLMPDSAERILESGETQEVSVRALRPGDNILLRPGTTIPADGEVTSGESEVNESMMTGESRPVAKASGDKVIAGTINGDGSLRVQVTASGDQTALAGIMRLVEEAQRSKSSTQILADRAAGWLFYIAIGVAALTGVAWFLVVGFEVEVIARVATVLVIACPHALGLAVPLVVAITTSIGASNGILVRDRLALEKARLLDTVVFDKTGTLTKGEFGVVDIRTVEGWETDDALALTAAIEGDSEHTIARGIRQTAKERGLALPHVGHFEAIKGRGIRAEHDGHPVHVGGPRMLELLQAAVPPSLADFERRASENAHSVVFLIDDGRVVSALALADVIRPESFQAVRRLHEMGVQVAMLTGDSRSVAASVARELGIDRVFAEVLPEDKDKKVQELKREGRLVAMVGDGVNDAPALTRADVGIAIGSGTDVAIESAGIILVRSNPLDVVKTIELSRASYSKMIQNLIWATGYNVIALPLAAGVLAPIGILLSPALGALLMSISTVIVSINAQLMRRLRLSGGAA